MAENEISALKDALRNQYIIIKKLSAELEEEREASATAASETLSMILRLQKEKAAEQMEFSQYKRMAEEEIHHAEEGIEYLEEIIQQNKMEITSLKYQLEICKQKLARHGFDIPDVGQMTLEEQSFTGSHVPMDRTSFHGPIRRNVSLPSLLQLDHYASENDTKHVGELAESDSFVWKQAEEMNRKLKELMQTKNADGLLSVSSIPNFELLRFPSVGSLISEQEYGPCSWYSAVSRAISFGLTTGGIRKKSVDHDNSCFSKVRGSESVTKFDGLICSSLGAGPNGNTVHPASVRDVFSLSEKHSVCNPSQTCKQVPEESVHEANISEKSSQMSHESGDRLFKSDEWLNMAIMGQYGNKFSSPKRPPNLPRGSKSSTPNKGTLGYQWAFGDPKGEVGTSQVAFEQLRQSLKQLQNDTVVMQGDTEKNTEQLVLLRNIFKQLNTIEKHMRKPTSKKQAINNDPKVESIMEAVLSFSI